MKKRPKIIYKYLVKNNKMHLCYLNKYVCIFIFLATNA